MAEMTQTEAVERIDANIKVTDSNCHEWTGHLNTGGYGQIRWETKQWLVHRLNYQRYKGPIPEGICVLHKCDNRKCVNPDHLFLGTKKDNYIDMVNKGRDTKAVSEKNGNAKLNNLLVSVIREALDLGYKGSQIARYFRVREHTISSIKTGKTWR